MSIQPTHTLIIKSIPIKFNFEEFCEFLLNKRGGEKVLGRAKTVFNNINDSYTAGAVFCMLRVKAITSTIVVLEKLETKTELKLNMGWAGKFLEGAEYVIAGAYTTGEQLERKAKEASQSNRYIDAYIIEQMGLALLGKIGGFVNSKIESIAAERNFGVGSLLSPGSVHGWELTDQPNLCSHLPIAEITISCRPDCVLSPINSVTFTVGVGQKYTSRKIGPPCDVCSRREKCETRV